MSAIIVSLFDIIWKLLADLGIQNAVGSQFLPSNTNWQISCLYFLSLVIFNPPSDPFRSSLMGYEGSSSEAIFWPCFWGRRVAGQNQGDHQETAEILDNDTMIKSSGSLLSNISTKISYIWPVSWTVKLTWTFTIGCKDIQGIKRMWNIPWYPSSIFMDQWKMESMEPNIPFTSFHLDYKGIKPQISGIALSSQDDFLQQLERVAEGHRGAQFHRNSSKWRGTIVRKTHGKPLYFSTCQVRVSRF